MQLIEGGDAPAALATPLAAPMEGKRRSGWLRLPPEESDDTRRQGARPRPKAQASRPPDWRQKRGSGVGVGAGAGVEAGAGRGDS